MIKKTNNGWLVDIQPAGRGGKRYRQTFKTKAEAQQWEVWTKNQVLSNSEWNAPKKDLRKLLELVEVWYQQHGIGLAAGFDTYKRLKAMSVAMGNLIADNFSADVFAEYRKARLDAGVTANNMNREHAYLRAMFNELRRLGHWKKANPLADLRGFKIQEKELTFLTLEQVDLLLHSFVNANNPHVRLVTKVCLSTGARWSEAEGLEISQVKNQQIQMVETKSRKVRSIPIDEELEKEIVEHHKIHGFGKKIFGSCSGAFKEAIERSGIELPKGQMTHVLRHTFASHFMMEGGNIITLQRILGHQSLTTTMRYAHLSPDHLREARVLNPIAILKKR